MNFFINIFIKQTLLFMIIFQHVPAQLQERPEVMIYGRSKAVETCKLFSLITATADAHVLKVHVLCSRFGLLDKVHFQQF
jgi:hypothetical protein